ncbi:MAG: 4Fe-4S binding protein [Anaerolineae bacterium]|jgi:NosR/NirI family transcriptional regulator, nitrous oxide reductase regulator|nr:4Fe-4S binding protein [Anaerolineae bacterium]MBT7189668.1 4Fe-4S binding protein [Anaerolineae bacterium]
MNPIQTIKIDQKNNRSKNPKKTERLLGILALLSFIVAWAIGYQLENADVEPYLHQVMPAASHFEKLDAISYAAYTDTDAQTPSGYIGIGESNGYGGPLKLAVAVDLEGTITGMAVIQHRETPSWFRKVNESGFLKSFLSKSYEDAFQLGEDVDGITSATYTSRAIAESALEGSRSIAANQLGFDVPPIPKPKIAFGTPEIALLALFGVGYFGHQRNSKYKKQLRWSSLLVGMVVLGFMYNKPFTLSMINQVLLGFWPQWQSNLYWYLMIGGIVFVFTVDNKNPYCQWFCPFGAAQECMGAIGGAKNYSPGRYRNFFKWLRRGVVWFAILVALLFRSPGLTSYEIFGTLFALVGSNPQFILLGIVLIVALFIKRPWCTYLCPIGPVDEFIRMVRKWILEKAKKKF